jgi:hypothetical protein
VGVLLTTPCGVRIKVNSPSLRDDLFAALLDKPRVGATLALGSAVVLRVNRKGVRIDVDEEHSRRWTFEGESAAALRVSAAPYGSAVHAIVMARAPSPA